MWQIGSGRIPRPVSQLAVGGVATIAVSALGVALMLPAQGPVEAAWADVAAIDESSSTLGFADSDMYDLTPAQIDQHLDQMQAMGVNNVRIMIPWAAVEFYPDAYDYSTVDYMVNAADARGMGVLAVLNSSPYWAVPAGQPGISGQPANPADYAEFVSKVAQRYQGKVGAYEIWNEPNSALSFAPSPDPVKYTQLLQAAYPAIKAADPNAVVVGGVTGAVVDYGNILKNPVSFTQEMYDAGAEGYFDALSFHPYLYSLPFSQGAPYPQSPLTQLSQMRQIMVANGDGDKLIWASEYGEPTSVVDEATQAAYLNDMITTWRTLGYTGPTFVYTLNDRDSASTDPEATLGVIRSDGTWKPAAYVIRDLANDPATVQLAASMSRMSFASPEAAAAAPAEAVAATNPTDPAAIPALVPTLAPTAPETPADAAATVAQTSMNAAMTTVASLASMNPVTVATTSLAAANQVAATTLNQVGEMVGQMAAMAAGQTPAVTPRTPATPVTSGADTTAPQEVSPLQEAAAALTPTPTGGLGATPEQAQGTARSGVLSPTLPDAVPDAVARETAARRATPAAPATPATPAIPATPATPATAAEGASNGPSQTAGPDRQRVRGDRDGARQDRSVARQDRSDRRGGDRERPRRGR
jgi:hypothetical protein